MKRGALFLTLTLLPLVSEACVGCREPGSDVIATESHTVAAGAAFSSSVVFLLVFALLAASGLVGFIWRTCRNLEQDRTTL